MKRSVAVEVGGKRIVVKSDARQDYVRDLARLVDEKLKGHNKAKAQSYQAAVLAAMSIADDLIRERTERETFRSKVRTRSRRILEILDREVSQEA